MVENEESFDIVIDIFVTVIEDVPVDESNPEGELYDGGDGMDDFYDESLDSDLMEALEFIEFEDSFWEIFNIDIADDAILDDHLNFGNSQQ